MGGEASRLFPEDRSAATALAEEVRRLLTGDVGERVLDQGGQFVTTAALPPSRPLIYPQHRLPGLAAQHFPPAGLPVQKVTHSKPADVLGGLHCKRPASFHDRVGRGVTEDVDGSQSVGHDEFLTPRPRQTCEGRAAERIVDRGSGQPLQFFTASSWSNSRTIVPDREGRRVAVFSILISAVPGELFLQDRTARAEFNR